jgi:hypothetical protein
MSLGTILIVLLVLIVAGVLPTWRHSRSWGWGPVSVVGLVLGAVIVLSLLDRIP